MRKHQLSCVVKYMLTYIQRLIVKTSQVLITVVGVLESISAVIKMDS